MMKRRTATGISGGNMMTVEEDVAIGVTFDVSPSSSARNGSNGNEEEEVPLVASSSSCMGWVSSVFAAPPPPEQFSSTYLTNDSKIQGILRNIVWSDTFYEPSTTRSSSSTGADEDIIAVFDINVKQLRQTLEAQCILHGLALLFSLFVFLVSLIPTGEDSYHKFVDFVAPFLLFLLVLGLFQSVAFSLKEINMLGRRHIAVATHGIYLDASTDAHTNQLAQRRIIPFYAIRSCSVNEVGFIQPVFQVSIVRKRSHELVTHTLAGLSSGQAFVDLVNALREQANNATGQDADASVAVVVGTESVSAAASVMAKECD